MQNLKIRKLPVAANAEALVNLLAKPAVPLVINPAKELRANKKSNVNKLLSIRRIGA